MFKMNSIPEHMEKMNGPYLMMALLLFALVQILISLLICKTSSGEDGDRDKYRKQKKTQHVFYGRNSLFRISARWRYNTGPDWHDREQIPVCVGYQSMLPHKMRTCHVSDEDDLF